MSVGANANVVDDEVGWVCPTTSAVGLAETIRHAFGDHSGARVRGMVARSLYERSYLPGMVARSLLEIYDGLGLAPASSTADPFLSGDCLYGEDPSDEGMARWVAVDREACADLGPRELTTESYGRGRFDHFHGVSRLPDGRFKSVLGLGSAQGGEFLAIIDRIDELTIVEPSQKLRSHRLGGLQPRYVDPSPDATFPFPDASFDLVFYLSVLHHIPRVSAQVRELARVLSPGVHELTKRERDTLSRSFAPCLRMGVSWSSTRHCATARSRDVCPPATTLSGRFAPIACCRRPPLGTTAATPRPPSRRSAPLARTSW